MSGNIKRILMLGIAGLVLVGCSSTPDPRLPAEPADAVTTEQDEDSAAAPASDAGTETTSVVYEWDTQYSAFLSPPIEVRRLAKNDCVAAGYEIAVVETLRLEGNVATAVFLCRGDFE